MWRIWVAALFWGLNWPIVKILLDGAGPWSLRSFGLSLGYLLLAATALVSGQSLAIPRQHWVRLVVAGLLNVVGFNICSVFAQITLPASRAVILTYTMPLWSVVFARLMLGERIDALRAGALALGACGIVLLTRPFWPQFATLDVPVGFMYVMGAAICWAAGTVYSKARPVAATPIAITAWQIFIGACVATAGLYFFETPRLDLDRPEIALTFAYHVIFPQAAAYALWFGMIARVPASTAAIGTLLVPVFGVLGAVILIGERPTPLDMVGFAIILSAVLLDQGVRTWIENRREASARGGP